MNANIMVTPVMMATMMPDNYSRRKDQYRKKVREKDKEKKENMFNLNAAFYEPTDPDTALREFYATYGK